VDLRNVKREAIARRLVSAVCLSTGLLVPVSAEAEPASGDDEAAEKAFRRGREAYEAGDLPAARQAYAQSWELRKSPDTACNYGVLELRLENPVLGAQLLTYCKRLSPAGTTAEQIALREKFLGMAKEKVGSLVVTVSEDGTAADGADVMIDGEPRGRTPLEDPLFVLPGEHVVAGFWRGRDTHEKVVSVRAGKEEAVSLEVIAPDTPDEPTNNGAAPAGPEGDRPVWPLLVFGGVAIVGMGVGIAGIAMASSARSDFEDFTPDASGCDAVCSNEQQGHLDDEATFGTMGAIGFVGAGLAMAGGVVLHLTLPREAEAEKSKAGSVWLVPSPGGAVVGGTF